MKHQVFYQGINVNTRRERIICACGEMFDSSAYHMASTEYAQHLKDERKKMLSPPPPPPEFGG